MAAQNQHLSEKSKIFWEEATLSFLGTSNDSQCMSVCFSWMICSQLHWFVATVLTLFLHQNGSNVKNWPPINTHQAPLGSGISTRDGIFSNDNDQSNIIIDRYHTFTFCLLVQEFPLKRRTFDRLFEYLSRSLCSETEIVFFNLETTLKTFFCKCHFSFYFCKCHFSLVGIEFMPPEEKRG